TLSTMPTTVNGGPSNDTFTVSPSDKNLDKIDGTLIVNGGGGTDALTANDQNNSANTAYAINPTSPSRTGAATIGRFGVEGLNRIGGSGSNTYDVNTTISPTPVTITAGAANDGLILSPTARNLNAIQGAVSFNGGGGNDGVTADDQNGTAATTYTVTSTGLS